MECDNAMRRQVLSLPDLMESQYLDLEARSRKVLPTPEIFRIQKIILTGCGDSLAAGMAAKYAFESVAGIPTECVPSIDLSRFYSEIHLGFYPNNSLVIAVSNSGQIARIGEAVQRAHKFGAKVLGVTANEQSLLGKNSDYIMKISIPTFESASGVRTYLVSLMALLLLAVRFSEVRGKITMDMANVYRNDFGSQANLLRSLLPKMDQECLQVAAKWKGCPAFDFIGSGSDYGTAWYGHAKVFEATGKFAMCANSEDWLHLNVFMRDVNQIGTIIIAGSENAAMSRTKETMTHIAELGRPSILITDGDLDGFGPQIEKIRVPSASFSFMSPLTQFCPIALLMGYIAVMTGEKDGRGCEGKWSFCEGGGAVRNSEIFL